MKVRLFGNVLDSPGRVVAARRYAVYHRTCGHVFAVLLARVDAEAFAGELGLARGFRVRVATGGDDVDVEKCGNCVTWELRAKMAAAAE